MLGLGGVYNTWLLIAVLRFLDGDTDSTWNLIKAIGYDRVPCHCTGSSVSGTV